MVLCLYRLALSSQIILGGCFSAKIKLYFDVLEFELSFSFVCVPTAPKPIAEIKFFLGKILKPDCSQHE